MIKSLALRTYLFFLELTTGCLFLFLFYIHNKELPPIFLLLALSLTCFIAFILALGKLSNRSKYVYFFVILPLELAVGSFSNLSLLLLALLGLFIYWRGVSLYKDYYQYNHAFLLMISLVIGLIGTIYSAMAHYPYQSYFIYLLIFQIVISLVGHFLNKWSSLSADRAKFVLYFVKLLAVTAAVGLAVTFLYKGIQAGFFGILQAVVWIFSSLAAPVFYLFHLLVRLFGNKDGKPSDKPAELTGGAEGYRNQAHLFTGDWLGIVLTILAAVIVFLVIKRRLTPSAQMNSAALSVNISEAHNLSSRLFPNKKKGRPPEDVIRREIFDLEKYADKHHLGRFPYETLGEWWDRIGLIGSDATKDTYQKVRYGNEGSTMEEQIIMKEEIQILKQQLKEIDRNKKKTKNSTDL